MKKKYCVIVVKEVILKAFICKAPFQSCMLAGIGEGYSDSVLSRVCKCFCK